MMLSIAAFADQQNTGVARSKKLCCKWIANSKLMARPGPRKKNPTKLDRQQAKQDVKLIVFAGHTLADAARMRGVDLDTVKKWSSTEGWMAEIKRIQAFAKESSPNFTGPELVAFDLVKTNTETRSLLARTVNLTARHIAKKAETSPGAIFNEAQNFKAITGAAKDIGGGWEDGSGVKYAVAINLMEIARQPGMVRELTPEEMAQLEEDDGDAFTGKPFGQANHGRLSLSDSSERPPLNQGCRQ